MILTITDSVSVFTVDEKGAIELELKLNVTLLGHAWRTSIGDVLFAFGTKQPGAAPTLSVTSQQLAFLWKLVQKPGWESCKGMGLEDPE
jgi:hypothetical protein